MVIFAVFQTRLGLFTLGSWRSQFTGDFGVGKAEKAKEACPRACRVYNLNTPIDFWPFCGLRKRITTARVSSIYTWARKYQFMICAFPLFCWLFWFFAWFSLDFVADTRCLAKCKPMEVVRKTGKPSTSSFFTPSYMELSLSAVRGGCFGIDSYSNIPLTFHHMFELSTPTLEVL